MAKNSTKQLQNWVYDSSGVPFHGESKNERLNQTVVTKYDEVKLGEGGPN